MAAFQFLHQIPPSSDLTAAEVARIIDQNQSTEFHRLRGLPGFQLEPVSWEVVKELAAEGTAQSLGKLGRKPADLVTYAAFKRQVASEWLSMGDYMRDVLFGFPCSSTADGLNTCPQPPGPLKRVLNWRANDFPYNLEPGIEHHVLWSTEPLLQDDIQQVVTAKREGYETLYFRNPPSLASIPAIWHVHVMSRKRQSD